MSGIRDWGQSIARLQREFRELEVRDTAAHEYTAILEYMLPRDWRRPGADRARLDAMLEELARQAGEAGTQVDRVALIKR